MAVVLALARAGLHRRRGLVGLALMLAIGIGVAIASLEAARRTEDAYPSYLERAQVGDVAVNPSLITDRVEEVFASTPGLRGYATHSFLLVTPDDGSPRTRTEIESSPIQLLVSHDGRYVNQDRPVVHQGRMIRTGQEAFLSRETARALSLGVGDTLPLAFWPPGYAVPGLEEPTGTLESIGRATPTVVGIGVFADEVLVDDLYPRQRILVTPEVGAAFDCVPPQPPADDPRSLEQLATILLPRDCAATYRYYSLQVDGGDEDARAVVDSLAQRLAQLSESLPASMQEADIGYAVISSFTSEDRQALHQSLRPAVRALQVFGAGAAISTLIVALLVALRTSKRHEAAARTWFQLGASRAQRIGGVALPSIAAALIGLAGSLVVGWLASGIGPVASARTLEPQGHLALSMPLAASVLGASTVVLVAGAVLAAAGAVGVHQATVLRGPSWSARILNRTAHPSLAAGLRAAITGTGAKASLAASVAAVAAVAAVTVFTSSIGGFVTNPTRFGWPFDAAAMVGFGYGGADEEAIAATLDRPEVRRWSLAATATDSSINGVPVALIASRAGFDDVALPVIDGKRPVADDEIALGTLTARELGLEVGETATLTTPYAERTVKVGGLVVLPTIGPFEADRASLGNGALLSEQLTDKIIEESEQEGGLAPGTLTDFFASFVGIDLAEGVEPAAFFAEISDELVAWDVNGYEPFVYPEAVRPAAVADVESMRAVPLALAGVFAMAMLLGLGLSIAATTRGRRRELVVLRALGCVGSQIRASVRGHAMAIVGVGLVVGLPVGIAVGRNSYRAFAEGLGFFPEPVVSLNWTLGLVAAAAGMGLLASAGPARRAARSASTAVLAND